MGAIVSCRAFPGGRPLTLVSTFTAQERVLRASVQTTATMPGPLQCTGQQGSRPLQRLMAMSTSSWAKANEVDAPVPPVTMPTTTPGAGVVLNTTSLAEA